MEKITLKLSEFYQLEAELNGLSNQQTGEVISKGLLSEKIKLTTKYWLSDLNKKVAAEKESVEKLKEEYPNIVAVPCDLSRFNTHMQSSRFKFMAEYLQEDLDYDYLFICDSRDVLFQKNIEEFPLNGDLYAFEEEQIIGNCRFNFHWVRDVERVLQRPVPIQHKKVICSGTVIVSKQTAKHFLDSFSLQILY